MSNSIRDYLHRLPLRAVKNIDYHITHKMMHYEEYEMYHPLIIEVIKEREAAGETDD